MLFVIRRNMARTKGALSNYLNKLWLSSRSQYASLGHEGGWKYMYPIILYQSISYEMMNNNKSSYMASELILTVPGLVTEGEMRWNHCILSRVQGNKITSPAELLYDTTNQGYKYLDGLDQDYANYSASAMELPQSCAKSYIWCYYSQNNCVFQ